MKHPPLPFSRRPYLMLGAVFFCLLLPLSPLLADLDEANGLLPVPILAPRFVPLLLFPPHGPSPKADTMRISVGVGSGQVWKGDAGPGGAVSVSAQTLRLWVSGKWGITDFLEAGWELPFVYHARSFKKAQDPFRVRLQYGNALLVDRTVPAGGLSDARFSLGFSHRNAGDPLRRFRVQGVIKVPSGRTGAFEGTGRPDFGGFIDGTVSLHSSWFLHGLVGVVRMGSPSGLLGGRVEFKTAIPFQAAVEFRAGAGVGVLLQIEGSNNPYPDTGHPRLDEHPVQATLAATLRMGPSFEAFLAFSEGLARSAPDFAVTLGLAFSIP